MQNLEIVCYPNNLFIFSKKIAEIIVQSRENEECPLLPLRNVECPLVSLTNVAEI